MTIQEMLRNRRILLVEDEYFVATEIAELLRSFGAEVVGPFARLQPVLEAVRHEALDGALLDVRLDGETTEQVAVMLAARGVMVLLVTGYEAEQLPPGLRHLPRLGKPFSSGDLLQALRRLYSPEADDYHLDAVEEREHAPKPQRNQRTP